MKKGNRGASAGISFAARGMLQGVLAGEIAGGRIIFGAAGEPDCVFAGCGRAA